MKDNIIAGDSLSFTKTITGVAAGDGWTLKYRLIPRFVSAEAIDLTASMAGDAFQVVAAPSTTATWKAGSYGYAGWLERADEVRTIEQGQITVLPDPRVEAAGFDNRSMARKALEDCRAAFATFSSTHGRTRRYKIGEREMEFNSAADIIKQIKYWEGEVTKEDISAGRKNAFSGRILARI